MRFTPGPGRRRPLPADRPVVPVLAGAARTRPDASASSSSPTTSTTTCPTTWCAASATRSTSAGSSVNGSRILLLGLAYKKNTSDARESPSLRVAERLAAMGADARAADPHVHAEQIAPDAVLVDLTAEELVEADAVVLLADHDAFDLDAIATEARYVLDTRRRLPPGDNVEVL